jgi:GT2 family glycosyltransferase
METEKIGIVTVLYKSETVLDDFFDTLNGQTYRNFVLYVIDNKSPDNSLIKSKELAKNCWFDTKFIENDDNYGVAKGNNQGIEAALTDDCEYVLLSNNDVVLMPDTIENLYLGLKENHADMAVPKIYFYGTNLIWAAGGKFRKFLGITIHIGDHEIDKGQYDTNHIINYSPTCFMLIKKYFFFDIGLMDENYFVYFDDTDFVYRANLKNKRLYYIFNSVVGHKESSSTIRRSDFYYYYIFRNRIYFSKKHNKHYYFLFCINIIYHFTIRNIKMLHNRRQWKIIRNAIFDGIKL